MNTNGRGNLPPINATPWSDDEPDQERVPDLWAVIRTVFASWRLDKICKADVKNLNSRHMRLEAQQSMAVAELKAHIEFSDGLLVHEAKQHELEVSRRVRNLSNPELKVTLREEVERERGLQERKALKLSQPKSKKQKATVQPPPELPSAAQPDPLSRCVSADEIRSIAQKAVIRMSQIPESERQRKWAEWQASIQKEFPMLTAREIYQVASELYCLGQK